MDGNWILDHFFEMQFQDICQDIRNTIVVLGAEDDLLWTRSS